MGCHGGMNETAVVVEDLVKAFPAKGGHLTAVDHINFTIKQGEVVAFLGPNGAGKTTTIDMLLGVTDPTSGRVELMGRNAEEGARSGRVSRCPCRSALPGTRHRGGRPVQSWRRGRPDG